MKTFGAITDVPGITVGHAGDLKALTGCTVVLCAKGAVGAVDIRGAATGTREIDALSPHHLVEAIHAVLLTGGSAFGLDAAGGVMTFLEERGKGFDVGKTTVPIVPAAVIYDLGLGDFRVRPDLAMGYRACLNASTQVSEGSVGVGTGATVGKLFGMDRAMKGGVGTSSLRGPHGLVVGTLVVVNAFGDVIDPDSHKILAGARASKSGKRFTDSTAWIKRGVMRRRFGTSDLSRASRFNTTLGIIATNARLSKKDAYHVARIAHSGLSKVISPFHTTFDGNLLFVLSLGGKRADINTVGLLGETALMESALRAITKADGFGILPAYKDVKI